MTFLIDIAYLDLRDDLQNEVFAGSYCSVVKKLTGGGVGLFIVLFSKYPLVLGFSA
jgi:hypothetical protein